jgi:hypothetical protein
MTFIAVVNWGANGRVTKFARYEEEAAAAEHVEAFGGFFAPNPDGGTPRNWLVKNKTLSRVDPEATAEQVNAERSRRLDGGFVYRGVEYDSDKGARDSIASASAMALGAMIEDPGGEKGLRWADPDRDFAWIAANNVAVPMTAAECYAFAQAAMAYASSLIIAARNLKDIDPIPGDATDDKHWPDRTLD